jgi:hypothetical protein
MCDAEFRLRRHTEECFSVLLVVQGSRLARFGALGITAAAVLALPATSYATAGTDSAVCVLGAQTSSMGTMAQLLKDGMPQSSSGIYSFASSSSAQCVYIDTDGAADGHNDTGVYNGPLTGDGAFVSPICGNGATSGNAVLTLGTSGEPAQISFRYEVDFDGVGGSSAGDVRTDGTLAGRPAKGAGTVVFAWTPGNGRSTPCTETYVVGFNATATVTLTATS